MRAPNPRSRALARALVLVFDLALDLDLDLDLDFDPTVTYWEHEAGAAEVPADVPEDNRREPPPPPTLRVKVLILTWILRVLTLKHVKTQKRAESKSGPALFRESVFRRCPALPRGLPRSTIGAEGLNFRVRNGTGCFPLAMAAASLLGYQPGNGSRP